jgi:glycosyltransferase involved in cell wall biosynthesis
MKDDRHVHFVQSLEPLQGGGLGAAARQLHEAMLGSGVPSQLFATRAAGFSEDWPQARQFARKGPSKAYYSPELADAAKRVLGGDACFVHGHGLYVYPNFVFGRLARRYRHALIYHVHGFFEPWILGRSRAKKRIAHWLFEDANFKQVRLWRALTSKEADQIACVIGTASRVVVAPNGLDTRPVLPAKFGRLNGRKRALFLGRLHPKKGLDLLVRAGVSCGSAKDDWELVIAGPDEGGHESEVRRWVKEAGMQDQVVFTGPVAGAAKYELLASADLFVLTSYSEGFPMAPLEAMATGLPVLLTAECNLPEVERASAGWVCAAQAEAVAATLAVAIEADDAELQQRGQAGRRLVEESFNWEKTVATLREACQQIG